MGVTKLKLPNKMESHLDWDGERCYSNETAASGFFSHMKVWNKPELREHR